MLQLSGVSTKLVQIKRIIDRVCGAIFVIFREKIAILVLFWIPFRTVSKPFDN